MGANRITSNDGEEARNTQLQRASVLLSLIDAPSNKFTSWEQGFIAALTMFEASIDRKLAEIVERVA
jgi:hypothetical protein